MNFYFCWEIHFFLFSRFSGFFIEKKLDFLKTLLFIPVCGLPCEHVLQTGTEIPHFDFLIFLCFEWGGGGVLPPFRMLKNTPANIS